MLGDMLGDGAIRSRSGGRPWLPAAHTPALSPLSCSRPESEGKCSASAERTAGCPGFGERLGQGAELARLLVPGKEGAAEAAKAGWGGRGRASWGRS